MEHWGPLLVALEMTGPWLGEDLLQGPVEWMTSSCLGSERKRTVGIDKIITLWRSSGSIVANHLMYLKSVIGFTSEF